VLAPVAESLLLPATLVEPDGLASLATPAIVEAPAGFQLARLTVGRTCSNGALN
jgi:hypothetical protein